MKILTVRVIEGSQHLLECVYFNKCPIPAKAERRSSLPELTMKNLNAFDIFISSKHLIE